MSFYNTTRESGGDLLAYRNKAARQRDIILEFFLSRPDGQYPPSAIHHRLFGPSTPLTSIRRAITDLTSDGKLVKTDRKVKGRYGRPEYCWTLFKPEPRQRRLL
jgi:hypothetical protein